MKRTGIHSLGMRPAFIKPTVFILTFLIGGLFLSCAKKQTGNEAPSRRALEPSAILSPKLTRHVDWLLQKIEATEAQRKKVKSNLNELLLEMGRVNKDYRDMMDDLVQTFNQEHADRGTFDAIRSKRMERFDLSSQRMVDAIFGIYDVLTPEQRQKVAELWDRRDDRW